MRGKEKVLGEVGLMFIGYNLSRCISVLGAEKLIRALRERCLLSIMRFFRPDLSLSNHHSEKYKNIDGLSLQKIYALYGCLLNPYEVSLIGK
jgi:hypothetical protein